MDLSAALHSLETADHVCHELRKPMAVIHAYAELLGDEIAGPLNEKQKGYTEIVLQSVQRLECLISDLFETFRVASSSVPRREDPQDLEALCHQVVAQLAPSCRNRSVRLAIRSQGKLVHPGLDALRLRSALARLIENALRFADDDEELVLSLERNGDRARFELNDPGPCLSEEEMQRIFELMYRPERDLHEPSVAGAGLGVCRVLVESLGGRIWAENGADHRTAFVLELPLGESPASGDGSRGQTRL
jgi:signal transduction histidine kinase